MTKQEMWAFVNEDRNAEFIMNLRERWSIESDHEDIQEYLETIKKRFECAFKIYKRPFGFDCQCDDGILNISVKAEGRYMKLVGKNKI